VQKYLSLTGHVYTPAYLAAGARKWNSLPADVRQILEQAARETQAYVYEQAAKLDNDLLDRIKAAGVRSTRPTRTPSSPPARRSTRSSARTCPKAASWSKRPSSSARGCEAAPRRPDELKRPSAPASPGADGVCVTRGARPAVDAALP
jgi:hypothetical protein